MDYTNNNGTDMPSKLNRKPSWNDGTPWNKLLFVAKIFSNADESAVNDLTRCVCRRIQASSHCDPCIKFFVRKKLTDVLDHIASNPYMSLLPMKIEVMRNPQFFSMAIRGGQIEILGARNMADAISFALIGFCNMFPDHDDKEMQMLWENCIYSAIINDTVISGDEEWEFAEIYDPPFRTFHAMVEKWIPVIREAVMKSSRFHLACHFRNVSEHNSYGMVSNMFKCCFSFNEQQEEIPDEEIKKRFRETFDLDLNDE